MKMRPSSVARLLAALGVAAALALGPGAAWAVSSSDAPGIAQRTLSDAEREFDSVRKAISDARSTERTAEQRLADADILLKSRDFGRATTVLNEILEKHPDHPTAYPDAVAMLGESYFQSRQLLSARRTFRLIADKSSESRMVRYVPRAYVRLVDIALKTQNSKDLDDLLARMGAYSSTDATLLYARAKGLLSKKDFAGARSLASGVPAGHMLHHQAKYLLGVIAMREAQAQAPPPKVAPGEPLPPAPPTRFTAAIEAFRQVTQLSADSPEHKRVVDLAWLAIGRLFYEADQWAEAVDAYLHVERTSPEFGTSLYELAWVYVRQNDTDKATRALEILAIVDPNNTYLADGSLLRADLLLRAGQFDKALGLYSSVKGEYDPMRERVDSFLKGVNDPAVYYDKLASENLDTIDNSSLLPPLAIQWAREAQDGPAAFALLDDISQCRELIRQSQTMVAKLRSVLASPNRVKAFPELRAGDERALLLLNRITAARGTLAQGLDDAEPSDVPGELAAVRQERRELQKRLSLLPLTDGDLADRETSAERQWNKVTQKLQQLQLQVDQIQALSNSLKRMIVEGLVGNKDPNQLKQWRDELDANERDLKTYREQITNLRKQAEYGRLQVGYGDQRFVEDEKLREAFRDKLAQELQLVSSLGGNAAEFAGRAQPVMSQAAAAENKMLAIRRDLLTEVGKKASEIEAVVQKEAANIASFTARLDALDQEARLVVGQVAMRNFGLVRDKLRNIVLRADVGSVEQAWEVREEQIYRVNTLRRERDREEKLLQDELKEVLDDSSDPGPGNLGDF